MEFVKPSGIAYGNVMLYGAPKTGKSTGAGTAPGSVLYLNVDLPNATRFVHSRDPEGRIMEPKIPPFEKGKKPLMGILNEIAKAVYQVPTWDTVVVDPIGELHRRLMEEASGRAIRPAINVFGDVAVHLERWCRHLCEAPVNFVIVAHELSTKDEDAGTIERVAFTGTKGGSETLSGKLMGMVDIVGYTGIRNIEGEGKRYVAQLVSARGRQGGDRFDCLGDVRDLDLAEWFRTAGIHTGTPNLKGVEASKEAA